MIIVGSYKGWIGEIATALGELIVIARLHAMDVALCSLGVTFVAAAAGLHGICAGFGDYAFVRFVFIVGARRAAMTFDAAYFGMYIFFQVLFTIDKHLLPYLQRRQFTRSPLTPGFF